MRHLAGVNDPIHRMFIKLLVDCLSVLYVSHKANIDYHWLGPSSDELPETDPRFKLRW